jgi:3',5'-cyclic AMP phosphodiesterase CpdA
MAYTHTLLFLIWIVTACYSKPKEVRLNRVFSSMFSLIHCSDIHMPLTAGIHWQERLSKRSIGWINWQRNRKHEHRLDVLQSLTAAIQSHDADHIAVTGDMMNLGLSYEIEEARAFLQSLGTSHNVSLVPGNHDAYVPGLFAKVCKSWLSYMSSDCVPEKDQPEEKDLFPYIRRRGDIVLIGLSSAVASAPFMATGKLGRNQRHKLAKLLESLKGKDCFVILMIHHHPIGGVVSRSKKLRDTRKLRKLLADAPVQPHLILHGHTHLPTHMMLDAGPSPIPVLGVPSASQKPEGRKPAAGYTLITIDKKNDRDWSCHFQRHFLKALPDNWQEENPVRLY